MDSESLSFQDDADRSGDVIMSDNDVDPNYEPSEEEVIKYAIYLGMNPEEDKEFLYIAREGLKAPVPKPWRACQTKSGEIYYFNFDTGESQWDHPCDDIFRRKFQELKALCNKGYHKEQKMSKQLMKKQQISKSVQLDSNHLLTGGSLNQDFTYSNRDNTAKDSLYSTSKKYPKEEFLYSGHLSINQEHFEKEYEEESDNEEPEIHESRDESFEHSGDYADESDHQQKQSTQKKPANHEEADVEDDSHMPETKNFYDDVSLNNGSNLDIDDHHALERSKTESEEAAENFKNQEIKEGEEGEEESQNFIQTQSHQQWGSKGLTEKTNDKASVIEGEDHEPNMFYEGSGQHEDDLSQEDMDDDHNDTEGGLFNGQESLQWRENKETEGDLEPERENGEQIDFNSRKQKAYIRSKANEEESVCFSDFKFAESETKKRRLDHTVEELEHEFDELLRKYDEELGAKFSEILGEYEQEYQKEAAQIYQEYQGQVEQIRKGIGQSPSQDKTNTLDSELSRMKKSLIERDGKDLREECEKLNQAFEAKKKEIESQDEGELLKIVKKDNEFESAKQELKHNIDENIKILQKLKQTSFKAGNQKNEKEFSETKKKTVFNKVEEELREFEKERTIHLQKEMNSMKQELNLKLASEKTRLEQVYRLSQEELKLLKAHIEESCAKNLQETMNILHKKQEKAIKELEKDELARAEEIATQKALAKAKVDHDKKMNTLQVEKMLYEKQSKKRLEEIQVQSLKKYEIEKMSFENQKNNEMKKLANEINGLLNQILAKDSCLSTIDKCSKDIEFVEKETAERNSVIHQLNFDTSELESKAKEAKSQISELQTKLHDLKRKLVIKNETLNKVNELHQQLDKIEQEISSTREKFIVPQKSSHQIDYSTTNETFMSHASNNNLNRLLKEVEEIKSAVKKRAVKKSVSVSRTAARNMSDFHNRTIDTTKLMSITNIDMEPQGGGEEEISKLILEENLDKEPTLDKNKNMRKSQEIRRSGPILGNYFTTDNRQKDQPYGFMNPAFNSLDTFQKPKTDWKAIIDAEKKNLAKHNTSINQKKAEARETHKHLKKEGEQYRMEHNAFKNSNNQSSTKKLQLEIFKKSLNDKIYEYNHRLCQIRDKENTLKMKEEALKKLESAFEESLLGMNISQTHLNDLYQEYRKIDLRNHPEPNSQAKSVERLGGIKEKPVTSSILNNQVETGRFNLNLMDILQRNKEAKEKNQVSANDESLKENDQIRANGLETRDKIADKIKSSIFQRKVLRKPSPSSILNLKSHFDNSKLSQDFSHLTKK